MSKHLIHSLTNQVFEKTVRKIVDRKLTNVLKNSGWVLSANVVSSILGVIQTILLGRFLDIEQFGLLAMVIAYVSIVNQLVDFRVWETTTKYTSDFWGKGDKDRVLAIIKLSYLIDFLSGVLAFVLIVLGASFVSKFIYHQPAMSDLAIWFGLSMLFATVDGTSQAILRVFDRFKWLAIWEVTNSFVKLVLVASVLLVGLGLREVLVAYSISAFVGGIGLLSLSAGVVKSVIGRGGGSISLLKGTYKELALFLFHTNVGSFWGAIIKDSDVMILGYFWGTRGVGYFKMAKTFVSLLARISEPVYQSLFPELTKMWAAGDILAYNKFIKKLTAIAGTLIILVVLIFSLAAPWLVSLTVGEEFLPAVSAIRIMVWGIVISVTFIWARPTIIAIGKPQIGNLAGGIGVVFYLIISMFVIPSYGYIGTAIMFLLPYSLGHIVIIIGYFLHLKNLSKPYLTVDIQKAL